MQGISGEVRAAIAAGQQSRKVLKSSSNAIRVIALMTENAELASEAVSCNGFAQHGFERRRAHQAVFTLRGWREPKTAVSLVQ